MPESQKQPRPATRRAAAQPSTSTAARTKETRKAKKGDTQPALAASTAAVDLDEVDWMFADDASHRSLAFFEGRRLEIAAMCARGLNATMEEFELREGREAFHFLTTLIACGEWLAETGDDAVWSRCSADEGARETPAQAYARIKAVAGVIARLVMHPMPLGLHAGEPMTRFLNAFLTFSKLEDVDEDKQRNLGTQIMAAAWTVCRIGVFRALLGHLNTGEIDAMAHEESEPFYEYLEAVDLLKDNCNIYPRGAEKDAYAQLLRELTFLLGRADALPIIIPATKPEQRTPDIARQILLQYLPQFARFRHSMELREGRFERSERTFADALAAVGTPDAFALFDACNAGQNGGPDEVAIFMCQDESCASFFQQVLAGAASSGVQPVLMDLRLF
jgi:hypothetical protein